MGNRVSLVAGADDDSGGFDDSVDDSSDDGVIGLQFFMKESSRWNTSISVGMKFNDFAFFVGPRVRFTDVLGEKGSYRFTQTVRWQTNNYWQFNPGIRLRLEFFFGADTIDQFYSREAEDSEDFRW